MLIEDRLQRAARADGVGELSTARVEVEREPIRLTHRADARVHDVHRYAPHPDESEKCLEVAANDVVHVLARALGTQPEPRCTDGDVAFREVLPVEAPAEHPIGAALSRERTIAHPWK